MSFCLRKLRRRELAERRVGGSRVWGRRAVLGIGTYLTYVEQSLYLIDSRLQEVCYVELTRQL